MYMNAIRALRQIAFQLERAGAPTYKVRAFRHAADVLTDLPPSAFEAHVHNGTLQDLPRIGPATRLAIEQAAAGETPTYLATLLAENPPTTPTVMRTALRGDCHTHSDWSDGGSPPWEMAEAARDIGHEWVALTDHSPRLSVANGLSAERLEQQLRLIDRLNDELAPFRLLTGIEVDILDDGSLDQRPDLLGGLDVVVASVHSKLRMPGALMTARMLTAIRDPNVDVLGHCTGRLAGRRGRPESEFDAEQVFTACREQGVAVEINCRPERRDPPDPLLTMAVELGCVFAIDTDAHAPGQLDWQHDGCVRAERHEIPADRVVNAWSADALLRWRT